MDPVQLASIAWVIGLGLLLATALTRLLRRGVGPVVLILGLVALGYLAYAEWQLAGDAFASVGILLFAGVLVGLGVWSLRRPAPVLELSIVAVAWYLVLRGTMGVAYVTTATGSLAWTAAVLLTMIATETRNPSVGTGQGILTLDAEPPTTVP